jgi:hypothetical protein
MLEESSAVAGEAMVVVSGSVNPSFFGSANQECVGGSEFTESEVVIFLSSPFASDLRAIAW